jgi:hypothetical protein
MSIFDSIEKYLPVDNSATEANEEVTDNDLKDILVSDKDENVVVEETEEDLDDFVNYCKQLTDTQVKNVYRKEKDAGRDEYARVAKAEAARRNINVFENTSVVEETIEEGKKDPKAKIRNKPNPVFDDKNPKVKDSKDHFPLKNLNQARNALARAGAFEKNPPKWYKGTLAQFKSRVRSAVKKAYPSIEVSK